MLTEAQRRAFALVEVGKVDMNGVRYLARSVEEFRELGGESDPRHPGYRQLPCVVDAIDQETGVATLTVLLDFGGRRGRTLKDVPFANPVGSWPAFSGDPGGTWHFITAT